MKPLPYNLFYKFICLNNNCLKVIGMSSTTPLHLINLQSSNRWSSPVNGDTRNTDNSSTYVNVLTNTNSYLSFMSPL